MFLEFSDPNYDVESEDIREFPKNIRYMTKLLVTTDSKISCIPTVLLITDYGR